MDPINIPILRHSRMVTLGLSVLFLVATLVISSSSNELDLSQHEYRNRSVSAPKQIACKMAFRYALIRYIRESIRTLATIGSTFWMDASARSGGQLERLRRWIPYKPLAVLPSQPACL